MAIEIVPGLTFTVKALREAAQVEAAQNRVAEVFDEWAGHPDVPVSDAELRRLIAEDAGFGTNPFAALHGITSSVEGLEK